MISLPRTRELLQVLAERDGVQHDACRAIERPLLERYAEDRVARGNVFEPSLSGTADAVAFYRFSYGFPTFRRAPEQIGATMLRAAESIGGFAVDATRRAVAAMRRDVVEQPILGFAVDPGGRRRFKLYLMFRDGADRPARALAREVLGASEAPSQPGRLHMLGLDIAGTGVSGAKLYLDHPGFSLTSAFTSRPRELGRCLTVHSLASPDDPSPEPLAIDFALGDGGLSWDEVARDAEPDRPAVVKAMRELGETFALQVRRVSFFRGTPGRLNVYYVLDEPEAERPSGP